MDITKVSQSASVTDQVLHPDNIGQPIGQCDRPSFTWI